MGTLTWVYQSWYQSSRSVWDSFGKASYKSTRLGRGSREERVKRKRQKFLVPKQWQFERILESLSILLQFPLLFFAFSLTINSWVLHHLLEYILLCLTSIRALSM